jgi:hypothetical protein
MFEGYDAKCEVRVRRSFRLPPIFVGEASDYSFACYDQETEALTDKGWIRYDQFQPGMKVACFNPTKKSLEFHKPEGGALVYNVEDIEMHRFKGESLDMLVTPKHRMHWVSQHGIENTASIEKMLESCSRPRFVAKIDNYDEGARLDYVHIPWVPLRGGRNLAYDLAPSRIPVNDFLELVGWYVSEGHALKQGSAISICQKKERHWPQIESLLQRLDGRGLAIWWNAEQKETGMMSACVADNSVYYWLRQHIGLKGHEKRLSPWLKGLCREHLQKLFDTMMLGDGTQDARGDRRSGATGPSCALSRLARVAFVLCIGCC